MVSKAQDSQNLLKFVYVDETRDGDGGTAVLKGVINAPKAMKVKIRSSFYAAGSLKKPTRAMFSLSHYWGEFTATQSSQEFAEEKEITLGKGDNYLTIEIDKGSYNIYQDESRAELEIVSSLDPSVGLDGWVGLSLIF